MSNFKPIIANNKPSPVPLVKGEQYYFCQCGRSAKQPFCDGAHAGTDFAPMKFTAEKDGPAYLCACKHTAKAPFCDGSHSKFDDAEIGKEGSGVTGKGL